MNKFFSNFTIKTMAIIKFRTEKGVYDKPTIDLSAHPAILGIKDPKKEWTLITECEGVKYSVDFIGGRPKKRS